MRGVTTSEEKLSMSNCACCGADMQMAVALAIVVSLAWSPAAANTVRTSNRTVSGAISILKHYEPGIGVGSFIGCGAITPIVTGALVWRTQRRELTSREVHVMLAGCVAGGIGTWLMNRWFDHLGPLPGFRPQKNQAAIGWRVLGTDPDPFIRLQMHRTFKDGRYQ